jgi:hypothetical protein
LTAARTRARLNKKEDTKFKSSNPAICAVVQEARSRRVWDDVEKANPQGRDRTLQGSRVM